MSTTEEKIQAEIEKASGMKISEMKMKLMAKGVLTSTFVEKAEFVRAYAEAMVKESESGVGGLAGGLKGLSVENVNDGDGDDDDDDDDDVDEPIAAELPPYMKQRVDKLKEIHEERELLMKKYLEERAALEAKYENLSQPFYEKRKTVVEGGLDDEIAAAAASSAAVSADDGEEKDAGIPQFWACAIHQMPVTQRLVEVDDLECLAAIRDIRCVSFENGEGFRLEFVFAPNDYFDNTVLTKTYEVPNLLLADEPILQKVEGCEIRWKAGKCLTSQTVTKQQKGTGKNAGQTRSVTKTVKRDSFFRFFTPPKMPSSIETASEEEVMELEQAFEDDYDCAQAFRSHIIPKAVSWFAGDAMEQEMEAAMEGMGFPSSLVEDDKTDPASE